MTYSIIKRSVNKMLIGKTFWKNVLLPTRSRTNDFHI